MTAALPGGRWRFLMGGAVVLTVMVSQFLQHFDPRVSARVQLAASPWWVAACVAVATLGIVAAAALRSRRHARAAVLVSATLVLLGAAGFTVWSVRAVTCRPLGEIWCCPSGPIR